MERLPKMISVSEKIYRQLLRLYPQAHRRNYAEQMAQLFRDQCRDAWRTQHSAGILKLWLRVLPDIAKTSVIEQITERNQTMKSINSKNAPTILLIVGLVLALSSFSRLIISMHGLFVLVIMAASLAIFAKAIIELLQPSSEWWKTALRTFVLMFIYAIFMPAWAKLKINGAIPNIPVSEDPEGIAIVVSLFANPIVTAIKLLQFLIQRRKN
jgi:hypothetical protein